MRAVSGRFSRNWTLTVFGPSAPRLMPVLASGTKHASIAPDGAVTVPGDLKGLPTEAEALALLRGLGAEDAQR